MKKVIKKVKRRPSQEPGAGEAGEADASAPAPSSPASTPQASEAVAAAEATSRLTESASEQTEAPEPDAANAGASSSATGSSDRLQIKPGAVPTRGRTQSARPVPLRPADPQGGVVWMPAGEVGPPPRFLGLLLWSWLARMLGLLVVVFGLIETVSLSENPDEFPVQFERWRLIVTIATAGLLWTAGEIAAAAKRIGGRVCRGAEA